MMKTLKPVLTGLTLGGALWVGMTYAGDLSPGFDGPHMGGSPWSCQAEKPWCGTEAVPVEDEIDEIFGFVGATPAPGTPPYDRDHPNRSDEEGAPWSKR